MFRELMSRVSATSISTSVVSQGQLPGFRHDNGETTRLLERLRSSVATADRADAWSSMFNWLSSLDTSLAMQAESAAFRLYQGIKESSAARIRHGVDALAELTGRPGAPIPSLSEGEAVLREAVEIMKSWALPAASRKGANASRRSKGSRSSSA
jgi:hypothetical protein